MSARPDVNAIWKGKDALRTGDEAQLPTREGAVHIAWFGHSLLKAPGDWPQVGVPELDIPGLVAELHRMARADGRTELPEGLSVGFAEGPHHLGYWLDGAGDARGKLRARANVPFRYVVAVGFMHMLGARSFDHPTLTQWAQRLLPKRFDSPRWHTLHKYRFIRLVREVAPTATFVNYMGPALSHQPELQPRIDARFECIRQTAEAAGAKVINVPVGAAFRAAEAAGRQRPELGVVLQQPDHLHLTPQGAVLAASVFYEALFAVDARGLPLPERYRGRLGGGDPAALTQLLQQVAHDTAQSYTPPPCDARLPEDDAGAELLRRGPTP